MFLGVFGNLMELITKSLPYWICHFGPLGFTRWRNREREREKVQYSTELAVFPANVGRGQNREPWFTNVAYELPGTVGQPSGRSTCTVCPFRVLSHVINCWSVQIVGS